MAWLAILTLLPDEVDAPKRLIIGMARNAEMYGRAGFVLLRQRVLNAT